MLLNIHLGKFTIFSEKLIMLAGTGCKVNATSCDRSLDSPKPRQLVPEVARVAAIIMVSPMATLAKIGCPSCVAFIPTGGTGVTPVPIGQIADLFAELQETTPMKRDIAIDSRDFPPCNARCQSTQ